MNEQQILSQNDNNKHHLSKLSSKDISEPTEEKKTDQIID